MKQRKPTLSKEELEAREEGKLMAEETMKKFKKQMDKLFPRGI